MIAVYISKERLIKSAGTAGYKDVMASLIKEKIIDSYTEDIVEIIFEKEKALHFQSVLEFYDTRIPPQGKIRSHKKGDE